MPTSKRKVKGRQPRLCHTRQLVWEKLAIFMRGTAPWRRWGVGCPEPQAVLACSPLLAGFHLLREAYQPAPAPPASRAPTSAVSNTPCIPQP